MKADTDAYLRYKVSTGHEANNKLKSCRFFADVQH